MRHLILPVAQGDAWWDNCCVQLSQRAAPHASVSLDWGSCWWFPPGIARLSVLLQSLSHGSSRPRRSRSRPSCTEAAARTSTPTTTCPGKYSSGRRYRLWGHLRTGWCQGPTGIRGFTPNPGLSLLAGFLPQGQHQQPTAARPHLPAGEAPSWPCSPPGSPGRRGILQWGDRLLIPLWPSCFPC